jgi:hypothetical protein
MSVAREGISHDLPSQRLPREPRARDLLRPGCEPSSPAGQPRGSADEGTPRAAALAPPLAAVVLVALEGTDHPAVHLSGLAGPVLERDAADGEQLVDQPTDLVVQPGP